MFTVRLPTTDHLINAKQALFAFNGDVYRSLDAASLQQGQIQFAQKHLMMLSGLYGLLRPLDLIQPYRLEMAAKFGIDNLSLYDFWQPLITAKLNAVMAKHNQKIIVNLASHEYSKVVDQKQSQPSGLMLISRSFVKENIAPSVYMLSVPVVAWRVLFKTIISML